MFGTQPPMVLTLRAMAREGVAPSAMLRRLIADHWPEVAGPNVIDRNLLVQYFAEAFCFRDGEAYPVFGWRPDGTGELKDSDLDRLLTKRIQRTRDPWERQESLPSPRSSGDTPLIGLK
jgi:hypothetical protein